MHDAVGDPRDIPKPIGAWYRENHRSLPWRQRRDAYAIWLSEVMLQQTRVETVIPYFQRFLARFPDARALAAADRDEVLRHWAGLGYYRRGAHLHDAARQLVRERAGEFPETPAELRELPGVGEYTAAAVASIAFGHAVPVIDGNVERVLCRYLALPGDPRRGAARTRVRAAAAEALDPARPGEHNQAMMELGATMCLPRNPECGICPLRRGCRARALNDPHRFPELAPRRATETQHWIAAVLLHGDEVLIARAPRDVELLPEHWGVPLARWNEGEPPGDEPALRVARSIGKEVFHTALRVGKPAAVVKHGITYRRLLIHPIGFELRRPPRTHRRLPLANAQELPALHRKIVAAVRCSR